MKPTYTKPISKCCFIAMTAVVLTSIFASCTADEIEVQPNSEINENFFKQNESNTSGSTLSDTISFDSNGDIIPPINPPTVPKPPKKP